jgi:hypothetical protein
LTIRINGYHVCDPLLSQMVCRGSDSRSFTFVNLVAKHLYRHIDQILGYFIIAAVIHNKDSWTDIQASANYLTESARLIVNRDCNRNLFYRTHGLVLIPRFGGWHGQTSGNCLYSL